MNDLIQALQSALTAGLRGSIGGRDLWAVIPKDYTLKELEQFQSEPEHLRGQYNTTETAQFCEYVTDHADPGLTAVFVDPETCTAVARLDHGTPDTPLWGRHRAALKLAPTPAFAALLKLHGATQKPADLIDWLADWAPHLAGAFSAVEPTPEDDDPDMSVSAAIQALRKMKTEVNRSAEHAEGQTGQSRSVLESAQVTSRLPVWVRFECAPYEGLAPRRLLVRVSYLPQDPPQIRTRILHLDSIKAEIGAEFAGQIASTLDVTRIYLGTYTPGY